MPSLACEDPGMKDGNVDVAKKCAVQRESGSSSFRGG